MDFKIDKFEKHSDERGHLVVFLQNSRLSKKDKEFGQIYFVTFEKPGVIRGNHYHKKWREWFGVVTGRVQVVLTDTRTNESKNLIIESHSDEYVRLEIGPYIAHAFINLSKHAALLNYANGEWHDRDTFPCILISNQKEAKNDNKKKKIG